MEMIDSQLLATIRRYTMLRYAKLSRLLACVRELESEQLAGDIVECGVWRGGSAGLLAASANPARHVWLFDSFVGLPPRTPEDGERAVGHRNNSAGRHYVKRLLFKHLAVPRQRVSIIKGWFQDTIPRESAAIQEIALLHLDSDFYESTQCCLEWLYDKVVPGGFVVLDDYWAWPGCKSATDEFFVARHMKVELTQVETQVSFRKPE